MRAPTATALVILAAIPAAGCAPEEGCGLSSTVADYSPRCEAALVLWPDESRLFVDDRLVAYLPPDPQPGTVYGGTTGRPITVLLDEQLAVSRATTVAFLGSLDTLRIDAQFEAGELSGTLDAVVEEGS